MKGLAEPTIEEMVDAILREYGAKPSALISILQDVQAIIHYLPEWALDRIAEELNLPRAQVYQVATFYQAFSLKPRGKYIINICRGTACHVQGAEKISEILQSELKILDGETTADGLFTLLSARCLGCCSLAPVMMIDGKIFAGVTSTKARKILEEYRKTT